MQTSTHWWNVHRIRHGIQCRQVLHQRQSRVFLRTYILWGGHTTLYVTKHNGTPSPPTRANPHGHNLPNVTIPSSCVWGNKRESLPWLVPRILRCTRTHDHPGGRIGSRARSRSLSEQPPVAFASRSPYQRRTTILQHRKITPCSNIGMRKVPPLRLRQGVHHRERPPIKSSTDRHVTHPLWCFFERYHIYHN